MLDLKNVGMAVGIPLIFCLKAQRHTVEVERSPSWIFQIPVWSHIIFMSPNGMLDPENTGIAVEILLISCLEAEIHAIKVYRPSSWIFPLPVWSHSLFVCPNGKLDPENIGIAIGFCWYLVWKQRYMHLMYWGRHFGLPTCGLVAQSLNSSHWNAGPNKHRFSRWNFVAILSGSGETCNWKMPAAILDFSTSGLVA